VSAAELRALHVPGDPLVLPNAWDAATARVVADAGFPAVATTSSGVAEALGYEDGERTPAEEMLAAVARIARVLDVPLTADMEAGYGLEPAELAQRLAAAGAAGLNYEDTDHANHPALQPVEEQARRIAGIKAGADLVVNARIDVHIRGGTTDAALARARAYRDAGADCVYPIGVADEPTIAAFVETGVPVNVLLRPGAPPIARLAELGVARVSLGHFLHAEMLDALRTRVEGLRAARSGARRRRGRALNRRGRRS
jgi:2-methylisocitrate lyase-like PEP mutase family enzyme